MSQSRKGGVGKSNSLQPTPPTGAWGKMHHCNFCGKNWKQRKRGTDIPTACPDCHAIRWWENPELAISHKRDK